MENDFQIKLAELEKEARSHLETEDYVQLLDIIHKIAGTTDRYEAETRLLPWRMKIFKVRFQKGVKECQEVLRGMREAVESLESAAKNLELSKIEEVCHSYRDLGIP